MRFLSSAGSRKDITGSRPVAGLPGRRFFTFWFTKTVDFVMEEVYLNSGQGARGRKPMEKTEAPKLRVDLTTEQREKAERIGRIEFKSAGAIRKPRYSTEAPV